MATSEEKMFEELGIKNPGDFQVVYGPDRLLIQLHRTTEKGIEGYLISREGSSPKRLLKDVQSTDIGEEREINYDGSQVKMVPYSRIEQPTGGRVA